MLAVSQSFGLQSLPGAAVGVGLGSAGLIAGIAAMLIWMAIGLRRVSYDLQADALRIRAPFYGRRVAKSVLKLDEAKIIDEAEFRAKQLSRTNGVGLPGYRVGWFRNKGAAEKALLFVTNRAKVLRVSTSEGYVLYLSADDPSGLLADLRSDQPKALSMARGGASPLYLFLPIGILLLALAGSFVYFVVGPKHLTVNDGSIEVSGSFYSTSVARNELGQARIVDLDREIELRPSSRSNGVDLLGYKEGWFKLHTGEKAFVVVSGSRAVYIPTTAGYAILFSPPDPDQLIASLH